MTASKKELIIKEASEIIAYDGIENFSLSVLAKRVNISKATLYNYFTSKEEIISVIISSGHKAFMKQGFSLNLNGNVQDVLLSATSHWINLFLKDENRRWLRVIFSTHFVNNESQSEYRLITLMLNSQAEVVISSFSLPPLYHQTITELFSSLLLTRLELALEEEEIHLEDEVKRISHLINLIKEKN